MLLYRLYSEGILLYFQVEPIFLLFSENQENTDEITTIESNRLQVNNHKPKRSCQIWQSLVQRPRRTFTKKQMEEHNLGIILIAMSSLFIFCQSFKIIPDLYELIQCNHVGSLGHNCEMKGPVSNRY